MTFTVVGIPQKPDPRRNGYMLDKSSGLFFGLLENPLWDHGFDWWWHSFVGINRCGAACAYAEMFDTCVMFAPESARARFITTPSLSSVHVFSKSNATSYVFQS